MKIHKIYDDNCEAIIYAIFFIGNGGKGASSTPDGK